MSISTNNPYKYQYVITEYAKIRLKKIGFSFGKIEQKLRGE